MFERAVGFYANLINVNAYHQPGVEAGKKAAGNVLAIQRKIIAFLKSNLNQKFTVPEIAKSIGQEDEAEIVYKICEHLVTNSARRIKKKTSSNVFDARYRMV